MLPHLLANTPLPDNYPRGAVHDPQQMGRPRSASMFPRRMHEELIHIPQRVMVEDRWLEVANRIFCPHQNVRTHNADQGKILIHQLLHASVKTFALLEF